MTKIKTTKEYQKEFDRWQKKYGCTLGGANGYCDGKNARRCPSAISTGKLWICEIPI